MGFECMSPDIDETPYIDELPVELVTRLAERKARTVAMRYTESLIIGSDQVAVLDGRIIGKPVDHEDAVGQLLGSSGRTIYLYTGLALLNSRNNHIQLNVEPYSVTFQVLTRNRIEAYLNYEKPYDCCGSLKCEGVGISLIEKLSGDDPNALIGLPLISLCKMLRQEGVSLF